jgi:hypothetical protein
MDPSPVPWIGGAIGGGVRGGSHGRDCAGVVVGAAVTRIVTTAYHPKRPAKKRKAVAIAGPANDLDPAYVVQLREGGIMTDYKQAGDLVPDDVYIRRRGTRAQIFG